MDGDNWPPALPSASPHTCEITRNVSVNVTLGHWEMRHGQEAAFSWLPHRGPRRELKTSTEGDVSSLNTAGCGEWALAL